MLITTMKYYRRLTDGNYGSTEIGMDFQLAEGEDPNEAMRIAKNFVNSELGLGVDPKQQEMYNEDISVKDAEAIKNIKPVVTEEEEEVTEAPKKKVAKKAVKKVAKKVVKKKAAIPYDRTLQVHKDIFLDLSSKLGMRKPVMNADEKQALKATSLHMEGKDMFEAGTTTVLNDFKLACQTFHLASLGNISNDV
jgi:hypothetical protein